MDARIDVRQAGPKATFEYITAAVQMDAQAYLCQHHEKMSPLQRAEHKALLVFLRTDWPAAVKVSVLSHYRVLSSDGVTLYDITVTGGEWTCSCPAHGPCWHRFYAKLCFYLAHSERMSIDDLKPAREPIEAGDGQVRSMAGRSRLLHDEVA